LLIPSPTSLVAALLAENPPWLQALLDRLPRWAQEFIGFVLTSVGGWGLFFIAFIDSSFGTLPVINDALVIALSLQNPERMPFYALMATAGSVLGCLTLYFFARKGGEVALRKKASAERIERIRNWFDRNEFFAIAIPCVLPPPTPFKIFVLAAGVFQVRLRYFVLALTLGRAVRYFFWGFLAVKFGERSILYLVNNYLQVSGIAVSLMLLGWLVMRLAQRYYNRRQAAAG
jgi:membrane protein YqaA with SNARE-associated domain